MLTPLKRIFSCIILTLVCLQLHAQNSCSGIATWLSTYSYNTGEQIKLNNQLYEANWWTQGQSPATNSGPVGSGQPWTALGSCGSTVAPTIEITSPLQDEVIELKESENPVIHITTDVNDDVTTIDSVKFIIVDVVCNGPGCANVRRYTVTSAPFELDIDPIYGPYHEINVVAFSNGQTAEDNVDYDIIKLPEAYITSHGDEQLVYVNPYTSEDITVKAESNVQGLDSMVFDIKAVKANSQDVDTRIVDYSAPFEATFFALLGYDNYQISATAYHDGYTAGAQTKQIEVIAEPLVIMNTPVDGESYYFQASNNPTFTVDVSVNDQISQIDSVHFIIVDVMHYGQGAAEVRRFSTYEAPYDLVYTPKFGAEYTETYAIAFSNGRASDASYHVTNHFIAVPEISIISPIEDEVIVVNEGESIDVTVEVNDDITDVDSVEYYIQEVSHPPHATVKETRYVVTSAPFNLSFVPERDRFFTRIVALPWGAEGKTTGSKSVQVEVRRAPQITFTSPAEGSTVISEIPFDPIDITIDYDNPDNLNLGVWYHVTDAYGSFNYNTIYPPYTMQYNLRADGPVKIEARIVGNGGKIVEYEVLNFTVEHAYACNTLTWSATEVYNTGDVVSFDRSEYRAKWYTTNEQPGTTGPWGVWEYLGACHASSAKKADESLQAATSVLAYPNPFTDIINVEGTSAFSTYIIQNNLGQVVAEGTVTGSSITVDGSDLVSGSYILQLVGQNTSKSITIIK